tara:strand:+ start:131 stop:502 length:372 start_codon:yes stop_codon:yes gene_type:complete
MAITYKWDIPQMNAHVEQAGKSNVIYVVHFRYSGSEEVDGITYYDTFIGTQSYQYEEGDDFVPYENTEAFEAVVIGWLEGSLNVEEMQTSISENIQSQITPVNEDLYFTWQNPTPVPPVDEEE